MTILTKAVGIPLKPPCVVYSSSANLGGRVPRDSPAPLALTGALRPSASSAGPAILPGTSRWRYSYMQSYGLPTGLPTIWPKATALSQHGKPVLS